MANDKDFKVKNGVKASAYYEAIGTVTSGVEGYLLSSASYDNKSVVVNQDPNPRDIYFKPDGTKFFIAGNNQDEINDYDCSTAWDISTATYNQSYVASNTTAPFGLAFSPDGTKMFVVDVAAPASVDEYSLSTAWDQTSATYVDSLDTSTEVADQGLVFNGDGTSLYVGTGGGTIYQYNMTTAYDVSTGSYASKSLDVSSQVTNDFGIDFNADGTKLFVLSYTGFAVYQYSLSTAYDISTGSYDNISFSVASEATTATNGITFGNSGTKMYVISLGDDTLYQYSTGVSTQTLDLSTGSVFEITADADVRIGLSNPAPSGTVSSATLILNGGSKTTYDIANLKGSGEQAKIGTLGAQFITSATVYLRGLFVGKNGSRMYVSDDNDNYIYQYNILRPPYLDSAVIAGMVDVGNTTGTVPTSIFFKPDGTKMYQIDTGNDAVYQWDLSTAWEISSATYNSKQLSIASQAVEGMGLWFKTDGTSLYVLDNTTDDVFQYDLTTAWDVSTGSYANKSISETSQQTSGIIFNDDGTKIFIGRTLEEYNLSTAWDISTATASGSTAGGSIDRYADKLTLTASGGKYFYLGNRTTRAPNRSYDPLREQKVARLYFGTPYSISYDSSVKFQRGSTRSAFNIGETRVITFTTRDGGTTYMAQEVMKGIDDNV